MRTTRARRAAGFDAAMLMIRRFDAPCHVDAAMLRCC